MARQPVAVEADLGQNLGALMEFRGVKQPALATKSGVPQTTISRILTGKSSPRSDNLRKLADALDCDINLLIGPHQPFVTALSQTGTGMRVQVDGNQSRPPSGGTVAREALGYPAPSRDEQNVSVVGVWRVDANGRIDETKFPAGEGGSIRRYGDTAGMRAVKVKGDHLEPWVSDGDFLVVRPGAECRPNKRFVLLLRNGEALIRRLIALRDDAIVSEHPVESGTDRRTIELVEVETMYPIVGTADADEHET